MPNSSSSTTDEEDTSHYGTVGGGGLAVILGTAVGFTFSFFAKTIPAGLLGPDQYGLLVLGFATVSTVYLVAQMGLPLGIARNLPRYDAPEDQRAIVLSAFSLSLPVAIALTVLLVIFSDWIAGNVFHKPELSYLISIFAILVPILTLQQLSVNVFRGYKRSRPRVIVRDVLNPVARFVLMTGAIVLGFGVGGAAFGWIAGVSVAALYGSYLLYRDTSIVKLRRFKPYYRMLLLFSLPLMVSTMSRTVLQQADSILLGVLQISNSQIAVYDIAFTVGRLITWALVAFNFLFVPVFSDLHERSATDEMNRLFKIVTKWVVLLTLPFYCMLVLYPEPILRIIGDEYAGGAFPLIVLSTGFFINTFLGLGKMSLVSIGSTRFVMLGDLGTAVVNVLLNIALIPRLGIKGAAIASALSYAGFNALYTYRLFRKYEIHPFSKYLLKPTIGGVLGVALIHFAVTSVTNVTLWLLPILGLAFAGMYLGAFLFFGGLQRQDLDVIRSIEAGLGIDLSIVERRLERLVEE